MPKIKLKFADSYRKTISSIDKFPVINRAVSNFMLPILLKRPRLVGIELTSACNADCVICPRKELSRGIGTMDFSLYSKIIDECIALGVKKILPYGYGESLILPDFGEYISYIRERSSKIKIILATNGSLLNKEKALSIIRSKVNMVFITINGITQETFGNIERGLLLKQVEANVINLITLRNSLHSSLPYVLVGIMDMRETKDEISEFIKKWSHIADSVCIGDYSSRGGSIVLTKKHSLMGRHSPCFALWNQVTICYTGNCALCCEDWDCNVSLGNLRNITLTEVWQGDKLNEIRELHRSGDSGKMYPCSLCTLTTRGTPWWWFK